MKSSNKAKWIVGISGIAFSAFVIGQLETTSDSNSASVEINETMTEREKELLQLDWSDFSIQGQSEGVADSDRTSRRSKED